ATPVVNVPCTLTVAGNENINIPLENSCPRFDTIIAYTTDSALITIQNLGCDTLFLTNISSSSNQFNIASYPSKINPYDSAFVTIVFAPTNPAGNKTTTITVQNSDADTTFCLQGYALPPPVLSVTPATLTTTLVCADSSTSTLTINNTGGTNLTYNITIQNPSFGTGQPLPPACTPTTSSYCCGMGIYNVTLNTLNNTTPDGSQGYMDYTATQSTFLIPGQTYSLSVRTGTSYNEYVEAWIDFNDDGTFQGGELIMNNLNALPNVMHTGTFTVPANAAKNSSVRMRVTSDYSGSPIPGPCTNPVYGQAEDYTIHLLGWVAVAPSTGTVTPSSSNTVAVTFNSTGLVVGTYTANIVISSNDPVDPSDTVFTTLVVTGAANFAFAGFGDTIAPNCLYLDSIMALTAITNEIHITNTGCDTLWIDSLTFSPSVFSLDTFAPFILPGDTGGIAVLFSPVAAGTYNGTVAIYTNDLDTVFCLKGYAFPPPVMTHYPSSFTVTVNCTDTVTDTLIVKNTGGSELFIDVSTFGKAKINAALVHADDASWLPDVQSKLMATGKFNLVDILDARFSTPTLAQLQAYDAILVWSDWSFNNATLLGNRVADYLDGGGGVVVAMGALANWGQLLGRFDTDDYWCIDPSPDIWGPTTTLGTVFSPGHPVMAGVSSFNGGTGSWRPSTFAVNPAATRIADWSDGHPLVAVRTINGSRRVDLGMWPVSNDAYSGSWLPSTDGAKLMANALFYSSTAGEPWLTVAPTKDTSAAGDSSIIQVTFNSSGLVVGTYTTNIVVNGNDPLNPTDTIPVTLVVNGSADFQFAGFADTALPAMCLGLDSIMEYTTSTDTVFITNLGCDTLWLDSIKFSPAAFSLDTAAPFILPGDTGEFVVLFSPVSTGTFTGTASLFTNDIDTAFCLKGIAFPRPIISFNPDTVLAALACCDSITVPVTVSNTGGSDLVFNILSSQNFTEGFENGLSKWITGGAQGANWVTVADPYTGAFSLKQSAGNYGDGWYQYIQLAQKLKVIDAANCNLSFWEKRAMECCCDFFRAQISVNGGPFTTLYSVNCNQAGWMQQNFPLSSYV
ncbi:MAG: GEVED domain-containing protein, partial [Bacteroidota bacterium]